MIKLSLNGEIIRADEISFADRLKYDDVLVHEGTDEDWEIFSINGSDNYVAYQQCSAYDRV